MERSYIKYFIGIPNQNFEIQLNKYKIIKLKLTILKLNNGIFVGILKNVTFIRKANLKITQRKWERKLNTYLIAIVAILTWF